MPASKLPPDQAGVDGSAGDGNGHRPVDALRETIEMAGEEYGLPLRALTVLAAQHDPYRLDTPARHRDGEWLAVQAEALGFAERVLHLRGVHYILVSGEVIKPDGRPYRNVERDWVWLQERAAKAARYLSYIPFDRIYDARSAIPVTKIWTPPDPKGYITAGVNVEIPDAEHFEPQVRAREFEGTQPYKLVFVGEKTSLREIVEPIADRHQADLYLPTGELSDSQAHTMARIAAEDGRRMVIFYLSDCDPAGWQMAVSVARKLQALETGHFAGLSYEMRPVALTPAQVKQHGLPSTPLKDTEKRAGDWLAAYGVEQTEIDALAGLNPDLLVKIIRAAVRPFFDYGLQERVRQAWEEWRERAQAALDIGMGPETRAAIAAELTERVGELREQIDAINDSLQGEVPDDIDLPPIEIPAAEITRKPDGLPLLDSDWDWATQTQALISHKAYES